MDMLESIDQGALSGWQKFCNQSGMHLLGPDLDELISM